MERDQILFDKNSNYNTLDQLKKEFPMFKECKKSIPPFIIPNTVNGACVIFRTNDNSHFTYSLASHSVDLIAPSKDLIDNFYTENNEINFPWILKDVLNISASYCKIKDDYYEFNYCKHKYGIALHYFKLSDAINNQSYSRISIYIYLLKDL